jgi:hypothetical protein
VKCGLPAHSPNAQTPGAVVSSRSLTRNEKAPAAESGGYHTASGAIRKAPQLERSGLDRRQDLFRSCRRTRRL